LNWAARRRETGLEPVVPVRFFGDLDSALAVYAAEEPDLMILDLPGAATPLTLEAMKASTLVIVPTNPGADDLLPTVAEIKAALEQGVPPHRLYVLFNFTDSLAETREAREFLAGNQCQFLDVRPIPYRVSIRRALNAGMVHTEIPVEIASRSSNIKNLAARVVEKVDEILQLIIEEEA